MLKPLSLWTNSGWLQREYYAPEAVSNFGIMMYFHKHTVPARPCALQLLLTKAGPGPGLCPQRLLPGSTPPDQIRPRLLATPIRF